MSEYEIAVETHVTDYSWREDARPALKRCIDDKGKTYIALSVGNYDIVDSLIEGTDAEYADAMQSYAELFTAMAKVLAEYRPVETRALQPVEQDADGWIPWDGGECPVEKHVKVDVQFRGGNSSYGCTASTWDWTEDSGRGDIVAYRVVEEQSR